MRHLINEFKKSDTVLSLSTEVPPTPVNSGKISACNQVNNNCLNENLIAYKQNQEEESSSLTSIKEEKIQETVEVNSFNSVVCFDKQNSEERHIETYKAIVKSETRRFIMLSDMTRKPTKLVDRKMMNYPRLIIAIATFYTLPVVQLVFLFQSQLTKSGDEDSCYFNFLCMVKSGPFVAFNNIFSNCGYILLGIMFIIIVKKRAYSYTFMRKKYPKIMATHGVPQHFGLFYTMGIGLIMEGILSAAYHVCPSYNNFQFDTSFMYILGVTSMLKLYQARHPDIHVSSQKVFLFLAFCILVNVIGVFYGKQNDWFIIVYSICHIGFIFGLSVVVYNMKTPNLKKIKKEMANINNQSIRTMPKPKYVERLVMLAIANIFNIGMAVHSILFPSQFSYHLLQLLMGNFLLYFLMYCINKIINGEKFAVVTIINMVIGLIVWTFALYFFNLKIKHWDVSLFRN